jgi:hypothetical protein
MAGNRRYGAYPGFPGYTPARFRRLSKAKKLAAMETWFGQHFEDPANHVSYNTREGGYLWVPGLGPNDANEAIQNEFGAVAGFELMMEAVEGVQADGILDWASKDFFREIDDEALHELEEGVPEALPTSFGGRPAAGTSPTFSEALGASPTTDVPGQPRRVFEPGVFEPGVFEDEARPDAATSRREMLARLDDLERMIEPLVAGVGMIGHNGPPGSIEDPDLPEVEPSLTDPPLTVRDLDVIKASISELRLQASAPRPDLAVVERSRGILGRAARFVGRWLLLAADEAVKAAGKTAGALLVAGAVMGWQQLAPALEGAASSVSAWAQTIEVPW